jgi:hypothetical protein
LLIVFLRFEISAVFADSPIYLDFEPKPTSDLLHCQRFVLQFYSWWGNGGLDIRCCSVRDFIGDLIYTLAYRKDR